MYESIKSKHFLKNALIDFIISRLLKATVMWNVECTDKLLGDWHGNRQGAANRFQVPLIIRK